MAVTVIASVSLAGSVGGKANTDPSAGGVGRTSIHTTMVIDWREGEPKTGAFEIKDFSFGVENPTTIGSATGGAGAGKIKFNEFIIKKTTDKSSPILFKKCATGEHIKEIVIEITKADKKGNETPFMTFKFETVFTTKIDWSGPGDEGPEESITFVYGKLGVTYHEQDKATGQMSNVTFGWDQVTNREG